MLPDIDLRLQAITKALEETVLPALKDGEQMARETVGLIMAQVTIIRAQWKTALNFDLGTYDALCEVGGKLQASITDDTVGAELAAVLREVGGLNRTDYDAVSRELRRLGLVLDRVIREDDVTTPMSQVMKDTMIAYGRHEAWRYRVYFASTGLDPDVRELPGIEALWRS